MPVLRPPRWTAPTATYIIATTPRSGSWLLSEGLAATMVAGDPREWFNSLEEQRHYAQWRMEHDSDLTFRRYLDQARVESTTSNGISGIKFHYYQMGQLPGRLAEIGAFTGRSPADVMAEMFPDARYIWLTRRDKVRQAISFLLAASTDEWWRVRGARQVRRDAHAREAEFDPQAIARMEQVFTDNDSRWQSFFADHAITPLHIDYEDLAADYSGTVRMVLRWLGVPAADSVAVSPSRLVRQSNGRNDDWFDRYTTLRNAEGPPWPCATPQTAHSAGDAQSESVRRVIATVPTAWKQWVGQSVVRRMPDSDIVTVLTRHGYSETAARTEVETAAMDPYLAGAGRHQRRLAKGAVLLTALGELARLDSRSSTVDRRSELSRDEFRDEYYAHNRPVVLQGLMSDWPAMIAWTPDYLKGVAGDVTVEVMSNRAAVLHHQTSRRGDPTTVRFGDYVDLVHSGRATNDGDLVLDDAFWHRPEAEPLLGDFTSFPQYLEPSPNGRRCALWFGLAGTVTLLHRLNANILLALVAGRKRYRLLPATEWEHVYNVCAGFSEVDREYPDLRRDPKFPDTTVLDVVVAPGEVLFVPVGWGCHERSLDVSIGVAFTNFVFPNNYRWE